MHRVEAKLLRKVWPKLFDGPKKFAKRAAADASSAKTVLLGSAEKNSPLAVVHCSFLLRSHVSEACFLLLRGSDSFSADMACEGWKGPFLNAESAKAAFAREGRLMGRLLKPSCQLRDTPPSRIRR